MRKSVATNQSASGNFVGARALTSAPPHNTESRRCHWLHRRKSRLMGRCPPNSLSNRTTARIAITPVPIKIFRYAMKERGTRQQMSAPDHAHQSAGKADRVQHKSTPDNHPNHVILSRSECHPDRNVATPLRDHVRENAVQSGAATTSASPANTLRSTAPRGRLCTDDETISCIVAT